MSDQRMSVPIPWGWERLIVAAGLAIIGAACTAGERDAAPGDTATAPTAQADAVDPCALVTQDEATAALGAPAGAAERPTEANNDNLSTCRYVAPRGQGVVVLAVMVYGIDVSRTAFQNAKAQPFPSEPISGVGDEAFWVDDPLNTLYVLKGNRYVSFGGDVPRDRLRDLAVNAMERVR